MMLWGIAEGTSRMSDFLMGTDCLANVGVMRSLGVRIDVDGNSVSIHGPGLSSSDRVGV